VVEFDETNNVISIEEKPKSPKVELRCARVYFYDNEVTIART
jgi:glucose-1-phosphate thymidylyltransferase